MLSCPAALSSHTNKGRPLFEALCYFLVLQVGARQVAVAPEARERLAAEGAGWARLLPDALCLHEFHQDQARTDGFCWWRLYAV